MKFWKWINGKKTVVAEFYWFGFATLILIWFPEGLPPVQNKVYLSVGVLFTAFGLGHKALKKKTVDAGKK